MEIHCKLLLEITLSLWLHPMHNRQLLLNRERVTVSFSKRFMLTVSALAALAITTCYAGDGSSEVGFSVTMNLCSAIKVFNTADLDFGNVVLGAAQNVEVNANSPGVAKFNATGDRNAHIIAKVVEQSIEMSNGTAGANNQVTVDNWNYGGNLKANGEGQFNVSGSLQDMRVGAVAHILSETEYGSYSGSATLRVTYI